MKEDRFTYQLASSRTGKLKQIVLFFILLVSVMAFAQDKTKEAERQFQKANNYVYEGNERIGEDDFVSAEMEYRKAISEQPTNTAGAYNLGNSYYQNGQFEEALYRHTQAAQNASTKAEKHKAYHNIGNILMQNKNCKEAVEAFKNALRNNPSDDETRYNFAIAKECAEQQQDNPDENDQQEKEDEKEGDDEEKDKGENEKNEDENEQNEDDQDKQEGDDQKDDQGKPKDEKDKNDGKEGDKKDQKAQPQPRQGQLSPQQIKNLLEAMNNQEQKVQDKINAEKQKGKKVKTEKDW